MFSALWVARFNGLKPKPANDDQDSRREGDHEGWEGELPVLRGAERLLHVSGAGVGGWVV
jgi:hypothetical protein